MRRNKLQIILLVLFLGSAAGLAAELYLMGHYEEFFQLFPLIMLGVGCLTATLATAGRSKPVAWLHWLAMAAMVGVGGFGSYLHIMAASEFNPGLEGFDKWWAAMRSPGMPALAPFAMAQLGAFGALIALPQLRNRPAPDSK